jgi:TPR repeat protein
MNYTEIRSLLLNLHMDDTLLEDIKIKRYSEYILKIRKLAYQANSNAQYDLAQHYENYNFLGNPNPNFNIKKRFYWYLKAANNNNDDACNNLADLFETGIGCEKDLKKALFYYEKSKILGNELGKRNYRQMLRDLKKGGIYNPIARK